MAFRRRRHQSLRLLDRGVGRVPRSPGRGPRRRELPGGIPAEGLERRATAVSALPGAGRSLPNRDRRRLLVIRGPRDGARRGLRSGRPTARAQCGRGGTAIFVYWLLHASVDWFWEFPGLTAPALACLGLAAALAPRASTAADAHPCGGPASGGLWPWRPQSCSSRWQRASPSRGSPRGRWTTPRGPGGQTRRGFAPASARAESLNPLSARAQLTAATIALQTDQLSVAKQDFAQALEREPRNTYALLELGVIAGQNRPRQGDAPTAPGPVLSPRDSDIARALRRLRQHRPLDLPSLNRSILRKARNRGSKVD